MRLKVLFTALAIGVALLLMVPHALAAPTTTPIVAPTPVPRTIHYYAWLFNAPLQVSLDIAECESQFKPWATNPGSSAKGLYQFLDGTWEHYAMKHWGADWVNHNPFNYGDNAELGTWVIANYGTNDWLASSGCWA